MQDIVIAVLAGYLLGSISFGILITKKVKGIDIRDYGSKSTGMTNVLRVAGKGPAALVLLGDALKGVAAVLIGMHYGGMSLGVIGGLAAIFGHAYPIFFNFKGGKGVATGCGVVLTLAPDVTAIALAVFLLVVLLSRYVSVGSLTAAVCVPILTLVFDKPIPLKIFGFLGAGFVIFAHRANIKRLYQGTESRIGKSMKK